MGNSTLIRNTLLIALIAAFGFAATGRALAKDQRTPSAMQLVSGDATSRFVSLGLGKSVVIDLPADIKDVLVADPTTANAFIRSARRAYIIGVKVGQTNIYFFDAEGYPSFRSRRWERTRNHEMPVLRLPRKQGHRLPGEQKGAVHPPAPGVPVLQAPLHDL